VALVLMPNASALWMAARPLWILDASINISMEPFRAFVADLLPEEQHTEGFAMQSLFIGLGAAVASALPFLVTRFVGVSATAPGVPLTVKPSFYLGRFFFERPGRRVILVRKRCLQLLCHLGGLRA
jgi:maltose/moltooligosaccharide transporter